MLECQSVLFTFFSLYLSLPQHENMKKYLYFPLLSGTAAVLSLWALLWSMLSLAWRQARGDGWLLASLLLLVSLPEISLPTGTRIIILKHKSDLVLSMKTSVMSQECPTIKSKLLQEAASLTALPWPVLSVEPSLPLCFYPNDSTFFYMQNASPLWASFSNFPSLQCFILLFCLETTLYPSRLHSDGFHDLPWEN